MGLLQEVEAVQTDREKEAAKRKKDNRERHLTEAAEKFRECFGEVADEVKPIRKVYDTGGGGTVEVVVLVRHDGVTLAYSYDGHARGEFRAVLTCGECGSEYLSGSTVYGYATGDQDKRRQQAVESLAKALKPDYDFYRHYCEQTALRTVKAAVREAAHRLKCSEHEVLRRYNT